MISCPRIFLLQYIQGKEQEGVINMEMEDMRNHPQFGSKSATDAALATGIIGTALGVMNGGFNVLGGNGAVGTSTNYVSKSEFDLQNQYERQIQAQQLEIASLNAEKISDQKDVQLYTQLKADINKLEDKLETRLTACEGAINAQTVWNATQQSAIGCINNQIEQLYSLTKLVIPNASVSPGWTS